MKNNGMIAVTIVIKGQERELCIPEGSSYEQLLLELEINPEEALIFVDGLPVPLDKNVTGEKVNILKIVSGG
jgi:sulfur carrier protein ThiS